MTADEDKYLDGDEDDSGTARWGRVLDGDEEDGGARKVAAAHGMEGTWTGTRMMAASNKSPEYVPWASYIFRWNTVFKAHP